MPVLLPLLLLILLAGLGFYSMLHTYKQNHHRHLPHVHMPHIHVNIRRKH